MGLKKYMLLPCAGALGGLPNILFFAKIPMHNLKSSGGVLRFRILVGKSGAPG
jgi:hypothetical protein